MKYLWLVVAIIVVGWIFQPLIPFIKSFKSSSTSSNKSTLSVRKIILFAVGIIAVFWLIGKFSNIETTHNDNAKVSYTCVWCRKIFVGNDGELGCYYYDENYKGCGHHTVTQNTLTGFCTPNHCELYRLANK
jgi:hypothetical protein